MLSLSTWDFQLCTLKDTHTMYNAIFTLIAGSLLLIGSHLLCLLNCKYDYNAFISGASSNLTFSVAVKLLLTSSNYTLITVYVMWRQSLTKCSIIADALYTGKRARMLQWVQWKRSRKMLKLVWLEWLPKLYRMIPSLISFHLLKVCGTVAVVLRSVCSITWICVLSLLSLCWQKITLNFLRFFAFFYVLSMYVQYVFVTNGGPNPKYFVFFRRSIFIC